MKIRSVSDGICTDKQSDLELESLSEVPEDVLQRTRAACYEASEESVKWRIIPGLEDFKEKQNKGLLSRLYDFLKK